MEIVLFAKLSFATYCKSTRCTTSSNTRIFASDFQFGEFHAILRGVFVKKIHNFSLFKFSMARLKTVGTFAAVQSGWTHWLRPIDSNRTGRKNFLILFPENAGEEHEHGHDFQSPHEHEQTQNPFDVVGQDGPRHGRAYLGAKRWTHVADTAQRNGDGIGVVDACHDHDRGRHDDHEDGEGEEGEERHQLGLRNVLAVDLHGQDGIGMQNLSEVVAYHLQQHHAADALEAAAGAARTGSQIHYDAQDDPRDVWPKGGIVVEHACGGHERYDLKQRTAERVFQSVVHAREEQIGDDACGHDDHGHVELELAVLEQGANLQLEDGNI